MSDDEKNSNRGGKSRPKRNVIAYDDYAMNNDQDQDDPMVTELREFRKWLSGPSVIVKPKAKSKSKKVTKEEEQDGDDEGDEVEVEEKTKAKPKRKPAVKKSDSEPKAKPKAKKRSASESKTTDSADKPKIEKLPDLVTITEPKRPDSSSTFQVKGVRF
jgi:hypothetical protein